MVTVIAFGWNNQSPRGTMATDLVGGAVGPGDLGTPPSSPVWNNVTVMTRRHHSVIENVLRRGQLMPGDLLIITFGLGLVEEGMNQICNFYD